MRLKLATSSIIIAALTACGSNIAQAAESNSSPKSADSSLVSVSNSGTVSVKNATDDKTISMGLATPKTVRLDGQTALIQSTQQGQEAVAHPTDGDGGQIAAVLSSNSPEYVDYHFSVPQGDSLKAETDGSLSINDSQGTRVGVVDTPWAIDASGVQRATRYEILNGNTIRQHVDLKGATFPVTADPSWWWWTKTVANCAGAVAPLIGLGGPALASKFPKIIKALQAGQKIPKINKAIKDAGGIQEAGKLIVKAAVNAIHDKLPSAVKGSFPHFNLGNKKLAGSVLFGFVWNQFWDFLGIGSCGQVFKELRK